jgi:hypothetical protein
MGALFGKTAKPEAPKPVVMPDADSAVVKNTADQQRRKVAARSGRQSTVLSSDGGSGSVYSSSLLGQ